MGSNWKSKTFESFISQYAECFVNTVVCSDLERETERQGIWRNNDTLPLSSNFSLNKSQELLCLTRDPCLFCFATLFGIAFQSLCIILLIRCTRAYLSKKTTSCISAAAASQYNRYAKAVHSWSAHRKRESFLCWWISSSKGFKINLPTTMSVVERFCRFRKTYGALHRV